LVVGAGAIGGVVAAGLVRGGRPAAVLTTNSAIAEALRTRGFEVSGKQSFSARAPDVRTELRSGDGEFDVVFLAVQPPHVESAAASVVASLAPEGRVVCFQNGLCEERVARLVGRDRVVGAVVAWGASMIDPGRYERTSTGGFTVGRIEGPLDARIEEIAAMLEAIGPVALTENLLGARWSKLAINCAISTLGTIAGDRVGSLMRRAFARRLALDVMTEAVRVARSLGIRLQKVAGTVDLEWLALPDLRVRRAGFGLAARHAVLISAGMKYRRLRSSMLAAIERGRPPAVDFLNGEIVERAAEQGLPAIVNRTACEFVWQIARGERKASLESLRELYDVTR
jgi:2-dehydropantoate 2-reductase